MDFTTRSNTQCTSTMCQLHTTDRCSKIHFSRHTKCPQVPPPIISPLPYQTQRETYLTKPSSEAETPVVPDCPSSQTNDLIFPSVLFPSALFPRTRGSASGRPRSNKRIFFSWPPFLSAWLYGCMEQMSLRLGGIGVGTEDLGRLSGQCDHVGMCGLLLLLPCPRFF
jgi:hypothetical protein